MSILSFLQVIRRGLPFLGGGHQGHWQIFVSLKLLSKPNHNSTQLNFTQSNSMLLVISLNLKYLGLTQSNLVLTLKQLNLVLIVVTKILFKPRGSFPILLLSLHFSFLWLLVVKFSQCKCKVTWIDYHKSEFLKCNSHSSICRDFLLI